MGSEMVQRMFLVPESQLQEKFLVIRLKHPKSNTTTLCALSSNKLFEIVHFKDEFSSWFVGDTVSQDGSLYLLTVVDPLFFILPYVNQNGKYCPLEDLLIDENYRDIHYLAKCCNSDELSNIFDSKESAGYKVFCYNSIKTLHWLQQKVKYMSSFLKSEHINIGDGSKVATLQTNEEKENTELLEHYSCNLISDYLSEDLSILLIKSLGLQIKEKPKLEESLQGKPKRPNTAVSPIEDYSKKFSMDSLKEKKVTKLSTAQKQLAKVDKKGMKSLTSFFQKK